MLGGAIEMSDAGARILAVDDDPQIRALLSAIGTRAGHEVTTAGTGQEFFEALDGLAPDLCILDVMLPDTDGLTILGRLREQHPDLPVIMHTATDTALMATSALKLGAFDYLVKPVETDKLLTAVRNALLAARQTRELRQLRTQVRDQYSFALIVGSSALGHAKEEARKIAASSASALILGESGTGKELFARAIHYNGPRAKGPFIDVNCAALTESLLESEIFGHEKGSFTGAVARRIGKFEQAHGGTIFLDEIGDMPLATQAKLLRVLQERTFQRVGGSEKVTVDVRVISATNQPLEKLVEKGSFRQDLFYRINTLTLEIPPLRERPQDIGELVGHFAAVAARAEGRRTPEVAPETLLLLKNHRWPGNVRELENAMRRAVVLCEGAAIEPAHLPPHLGAGAAPDGPPPEGAGMLGAVEALERRMIVEALDKCGWVKARAARALGITERILAYKMDGYGISRSWSAS